MRAFGLVIFFLYAAAAAAFASAFDVHRTLTPSV